MCSSVSRLYLIYFLCSFLTAIAFNDRDCFADTDKTIQEYTNGHQSSFSSKGHPKAWNADFTIHYPSTWKVKESQLPNTLVEIINESGAGTNSLRIITTKLPKQISAAEEIELLSIEKVKSEMPSKAVVRHAQQILLGGRRATELDLLASTDNSGIRLSHGITSYFFVSGQALVTVMFGATSLTGSDEDALQLHAQAKPLFKAIAESISFAEDPPAASPAPMVEATKRRDSSGGIQLLKLLSKGLLGLLIILVLGIAPLLALRHVILRRPLRKLSAGIISGGYFIVFIAIISGIGATRGEIISLLVLPFFAYQILSRGSKPSDRKNAS